jgi:hypothetical protein
MVMGKIRVIARARWLVFILGLLLGALIILGIRYFTYQPHSVHYHANFGVFINGERQQFKEPRFYQEVAVCSASHDITLPQQRAHMHENVNTVAHVHDSAVTWGQFFENLGWSIGSDFIVTDKGTKYFADDNNKLHIFINGEDYTDLTSISNRVIEDKSRLLVSFGDISDQTLQQQYKSVPATADKYNHDQDPGSCAGSHKVTPKDRLNNLF